MSEKKERKHRQRLWVLGGPTADIKTQYDIGTRLGEPGMYGAAHVCTHKETREQRAVKIIPKARFSRSPHQLQKMREEYELMRDLNHPNIIKAYEAFEDKKNFYIVMELCRGGELFNRIKLKSKYNEADAATVLRKIVLGLQHLHEHKVLAHSIIYMFNFFS
jgi:calcium-dependent protein kinase